MSHSNPHQVNPELDLVIERIVEVPKELVWKAWTTPEHLKKWFTPAPWSTVECEVDLRPGGRFSTTMRSPEGDQFPNEGCYLEVIENEKLVWTNSLTAGFRPVSRALEVPFITAIITFEPHPQGTKYVATAIHGDEASSKKHLEMGFYEGWGAVTDQLVALVKSW